MGGAGGGVVITGVAVTVMRDTIGVCVVVAGVGAPSAGAGLFSFGAVAIAVVRARRASIVEMDRKRIVGEKLVEGLVKMGEEFEG